MSGINIEYNNTCEHNLAANQVPCEGTNIVPNSNFANIIAGEIVNEILENALDIVTRMDETDWMAFKATHPDIKEEKFDISNICSNIVDNIVDMSTKPENINEIKKSSDPTQPHALEKEIKKLLEDMKAPPCDVVIYDKAPIKGGVGDQPFQNVPKDHPAECCTASKPPDAPSTVEKKLRVTDLVKNSRQLLNEYMGEAIDEKTKQKQEKFEEAEEQFLQVVELDCVKPGDYPFKAFIKLSPEEIPLPNDDDEGELIRIPADNTMDVVNLRPQEFEEEEKILISENQHRKGKGDDSNSATKTRVGDSGNISNSLSEKKHGAGSCDAKSKKKKWNLGTKLFGFLKKPKQKVPCSETSQNE